MPYPSQPHSITRPHHFACIDGHTCGNPVRLVTGGHPDLKGATMSARRQDFIERFDWIRTALMYEPRGHDIMSGAFLYPPVNKDCDAGIIYIEVSGCLPVCGHGTIGTVTFAIEEGLIRPRTEGIVVLDAPAGVIRAEYTEKDGLVDHVRLHNVPSYLAFTGVAIDCPGLGPLTVDIAYGGNFYAIVDPQKNYPGLDTFSADDIRRYSPLVRRLANEAVEAVHPLDRTIAGVSHVQWTGQPKDPKADGRNAVFYGDHGIDRSPCGTGTSARIAQLVAKGKLKKGETFVHESIIGSLFEGRVEETLVLGSLPAVVPSIAGWARITGKNIISVDPRDPFWKGFQLP